MRFAVRAVGDIREVRAGAGVEVRFKIGSMGWGRTGLGLGESPGLRSEVGLTSAAREGLGWLPLSLLPKVRFPLRLGYYGELSWSHSGMQYRNLFWPVPPLRAPCHFLADPQSVASWAEGTENICGGRGSSVSLAIPGASVLAE